MSARQPFIPQQRPPSRATPSTANKSDQNSVDDSLKPNGLLSEPANGANEQQLSLNARSRVSNPPTDMASLVNKPLNLTGFVKKRPHTVALPFGQPRKSFEENASRTASPRPQFNQHTMRVATPSPFFASSTGFMPVSAFRKAQAPSPSTLQPADDFSSNQAHIPTKPPGLDVSDNPDLTNFARSQSNLATSHLRNRSSSHPSLERINELVEEEVPEKHNGHDILMDSRDNMDLYHSSSSPVLEDHSVSVDAAAKHNSADAVHTHGSHDKPPLRRVQKRVTREEELEDSMDYGNVTKRFKSGFLDDQQTAYYAGPSCSSPQFDFNQDPILDNQFQMQVHAPSPVHVQNVRVQAPLSAYSLPVQQHTNDSINGAHALRRLLGQDLDMYVDAHADVYENARKKWAECTMDEWKAGADELAMKFSKMVDFVKDHMTTKLTLYASLDHTLAAHRNVLANRAGALKDAREALVRDGGNVISTKFGTGFALPPDLQTLGQARSQDSVGAALKE